MTDNVTCGCCGRTFNNCHTAMVHRTAKSKGPQRCKTDAEMFGNLYQRSDGVWCKRSYAISRPSSASSSGLY